MHGAQAKRTQTLVAPIIPVNSPNWALTHVVPYQLYLLRRKGGLSQGPGTFDRNLISSPKQTPDTYSSFGGILHTFMKSLNPTSCSLGRPLPTTSDHSDHTRQWQSFKGPCMFTLYHYEVGPNPTQETARTDRAD